MERREVMQMSGSSSYYLQRGMSELQGHEQGMPFQSSIGGSSSGQGQGQGLVVEPGGSTILSDGIGVGLGGAPSMQPSPTPVRRKRGRPRKYGPDAKVSLALSTTTSPTSWVMNTPTEKRGRGRPPGTGRKQQLPPFGELVSGSAGVGFTPHVISVAAGEDIAAKLLAFAQQGPRAICILSANGAISTATLRQSSTSGGTVTFEGRFDILCMSGSFLLIDNDNFRNRSGGLSVLLASPDGRIIGGGVGGLLIAASPVQVVIGSFIWTNSKTKARIERGTEGGGDSEHFGVENTMAGTQSVRHSQNLSSMDAWTDPQAVDIRHSHHVDIDLMRG